MNSLEALERIAFGEASPKEARIALAEALRNTSLVCVDRVYLALRSWVWKTLDARRRDPELRDWYAILKATRTAFPREHQVKAEHVRVLEELIGESIAVSEARSVANVMSRQHVREILRLLDQAPDGRMSRSDIGAKLNLKQANLTRILSMVATSGLIERLPYGREAIFQLTRTGMDEAKKLSEQLPAVIDISRGNTYRKRTHLLETREDTIAKEKDKYTLITQEQSGVYKISVLQQYTREISTTHNKGNCADQKHEPHTYGLSSIQAKKQMRLNYAKA